ncbi:MAG: hypothetical protein KJ069_18345 [Anaerolineae bacterium]|nr:hypothetical protein [Anaerolineae bacterium]
MTQAATIPITVELPSTLVKEIETAAHRQHRSPSDVVRELIVQRWPILPTLPDEVEAELAAFASLSDDVLWLLARSTMPKEEQAELARLNSQAKQRVLTEAEETHREALLQTYDRSMVRRAQAIMFLKSRGYDLV